MRTAGTRIRSVAAGARCSRSSRPLPAPAVRRAATGLPVCVCSEPPLVLFEGARVALGESELAGLEQAAHDLSGARLREDVDDDDLPGCNGGAQAVAAVAGEFAHQGRGLL